MIKTNRNFFCLFVRLCFLGILSVNISGVNLAYAVDYPEYPDLRGEKTLVLTASESTEDFSNVVVGKTGAVNIHFTQGNVLEGLKEADFILAVVRSNISLPFRRIYSGYAELKKDVEICLNQTAEKGHISVFKIEPDFELIEVYHSSFDWESVQY